VNNCSNQIVTGFIREKVVYDNNEQYANALIMRNGQTVPDEQASNFSSRI
jgi:hypothetical protein